MKPNRSGAAALFLWAWALFFVAIAVAQAAPNAAPLPRKQWTG